MYFDRYIQLFFIVYLKPICVKITSINRLLISTCIGGDTLYNLSSGKKSLVIILLAIIIGAGFFYTVSRGGNSETETGSTRYTIEDIQSMFYENSVDDKDLTEETLPEFSAVLQSADNLVGSGQYKIYSLYKVNYSEYGNSNTPSSYVLKIIPQNYKTEFETWGGHKSQNPYLVLFSKDENKKTVDNYYETLVLGLQYKKDISEEFANNSPEYKMTVNYNYFYYRTAQALGVKQGDSWDSILNNINYTQNDMNHIIIFTPYGLTENQVKEYMRSQEDFFRKYYVKGVSVCVLGKDIKLDETDVTHLNRYDPKVDKHYTYKIDENGKVGN